MSKKTSCRVLVVLPLLLGLLLLLAWWFKRFMVAKEEAIVKNDPVTVSEPQTKNLKKPKEKELRKLKDVFFAISEWTLG